MIGFNGSHTLSWFSCEVNRKSVQSPELSLCYFIDSLIQ
nr:MAG TPA: hypothetical protein [Caudoviricetes sp.]